MPEGGRQWIGRVLVGCALALGAYAEIAKIAAGRHTALDCALDVLTAAAFVGAGLWLRRRPDHRRIGTVLVLGGCAWMLEDLSTAQNDVAFTLSPFFQTGTSVALVYLALSFPSGRLRHAWERG